MEPVMRLVFQCSFVRGARFRAVGAGICRVFLLGALLLVMDVGPAVAQQVALYTNNFSAGAAGGLALGGISAAWTTSSTALTPSGRYGRFLGQFDNSNVRLQLTNLPAHRQVVLAFKLFIIQSWDGNAPTYGPDFWAYGAGSSTFLLTTFRNPTAIEEAAGQSYPGPYLSHFPSQTGALETNTLGYTFGNNLTPLAPSDSVYQFGRLFSHSGSSLDLFFTGSHLQGIGDESWGLDEVSVVILR